jgi:alkylhydroperoxidase family enzyme
VVATPLRSIAILTAVRERDSAYPWAAQVNLARRNGIREEVIDVIRAKADPGKLSEDERNVVLYARQLMRGNRVDQALFDKLNSRHGAAWMVEVTAAALYFAMVAGLANAFEVAPPADGDMLPA